MKPKKKEKMGKRDGVILLAVALVVGAILGVNAANMELIQKKLKLLNKPAIKTIHSEDGDIFHCVDIYKQPAFDHPALKNHTIQTKPNLNFKSETSTAQNESFQSTPFQTWQRSGSCPEGTIPIRRVQTQDLIRTNSLDHFGKKIAFGSIKLGPEINRSTAILVTAGMNYIGASGDISVWNPKVDFPNDFSASQIWLKNGPSEKFDSVEAGWVVNPKLYGDERTRLSVYWTADSYRSTGCFDLTCSGFVQTNPGVALGAAIKPWSAPGGGQYVISIGIFMDPKSNNWWLKVQGRPVGYWPAAVFGYLSHSATLVEWGGEVFSSNLKKTPHTGTAMGSGDYASGRYGYSAFVKQPRIVDYSLQLKYPQRIGVWADEPFCYSAENYQRTYTTEPVFFFGGPGRSRNCY